MKTSTNNKSMLNLQDNLTNDRRKIGETKEKIFELEIGVRPKAKVLEDVDAMIEAYADQVNQFAEELCYPGNTVIPTLVVNTATDAHAADVNSVFALFCKFLPDQVREEMKAQVDAFYQSSPSINDPKEIAILKGELHKLEIEEERIIRVLAQEGIRIPRRPDVNETIVLGL